MSRFTDKLTAGAPAQLGLWQSLANPYTAEICANAGFDWLLFDGEHAPNTVQTLLAQLQAVAAYPIEPIARIPASDPAVIKQYLDIGFRTLLAPMIDNAEQARSTVAAMRFPPDGIRGVASSVSRGARFGANRSFFADARTDLCLIVQIETRAGLDHIDEIAAMDGVHGLFIGPADLAASLGHLGNSAHPEVQKAIAHALARIAAAGKPSGIFATSPDDARQRIAEGVSFVSVGTDIGLLSNGARNLLSTVRT